MTAKIDKFMGLDPNRRYFFCKKHYDTNYNDLMEVVAKITQMGFKVTIANNYCGIENSGIAVTAATNIQAVYQAVCQFIDWYEI